MKRAPSHDIDEMTPDERLEEVALILAGGILRLHSRVTSNLEIPSESCQTGLDPVAASRPPRAEAVNAAENAKGGDA